MNLGDVIELEGWLVIIDFRLYLLPESYLEDYELGEKTEIADSEIIFLIIDKILPLGGGKSFVFHKAKIAGCVIGFAPIKIQPLALAVEERGRGFISISLEDKDLERAKLLYTDFLKKTWNRDGDWLHSL